MPSMPPMPLLRLVCYYQIVASALLLTVSVLFAAGEYWITAALFGSAGAVFTMLSAFLALVDILPAFGFMPMPEEHMPGCPNHPDFPEAEFPEEDDGEGWKHPA